MLRIPRSRLQNDYVLLWSELFDGGLIVDEGHDLVSDVRDGRLTNNPLNGRIVNLQRRPIGATTWTTIGRMTAGTTSGTYVLRQSPTATYEWRAVFPEPANEGLRGRNSGALTVSVSSCSGSTCPQSAPVALATGTLDRR